MNDLAYRQRPERAMAPRLLATPRFAGYIDGRLELPLHARAGFQACLKKLDELYPVVKDQWCGGGYQFAGRFEITTLWSDAPDKPDVFLLLGPGDLKWTYWQLSAQYARSPDERLLADLIEISYSAVV